MQVIELENTQYLYIIQNKYKGYNGFKYIKSYIYIFKTIISISLTISYKNINNLEMKLHTSI